MKSKIINGLPNSRQEGCWQFLLRYLEPVQGLEPPVVFDVVRPRLQAAVALSHVRNKQVLYKTLGVPKRVNLKRCLLIKVPRELNLSFKNLLIDLHWVIIAEGVDASDHLVRQDA